MRDASFVCFGFRGRASGYPKPNHNPETFEQARGNRLFSDEAPLQIHDEAFFRH